MQSATDAVTDHSLFVVPLTLKEANTAILVWHRHHKPVVSHRFSLGVIDSDGVLHGVAVVGRPVARLAGHPRDVAEVTRLASDGTPNACSMLYGAAAATCRAMGFIRIQTYTLESEAGVTLRAAGWEYEGKTTGGQWTGSDGKPRRTDQPTGPKKRWSRTWSRSRPSSIVLPMTESNKSYDLFEGKI
jgi:hypothetical protein